ncbi:MAG: hypothetical protein HGA86_07005 [Anaerolineaceae bacterium]|nr:hypothetical protein [Anaerolineaceae bacterium]
MKITRLFTTLLILLLSVLLVGCGGTKPSAQPGTTETVATDVVATDEAATEAPAASSGFTLEAPKTGSTNERLRELWKLTRPIVEADSTAGYSEDEYQARRTEIWAAYTDIQIADTMAATQSEPVGQIIPRILELVDHVYGWPGDSIEDRVKGRQDTDRTEYLIEDIESQIQAMP